MSGIHQALMAGGGGGSALSSIGATATGGRGGDGIVYINWGYGSAVPSNKA